MTKTILRSFLKALDTLQKELDLTNAQLADYIDVNRATLTRWRKKQTIPTIETIESIYHGLRDIAKDLTHETDVLFSLLPLEEGTF